MFLIAESLVVLKLMTLIRFSSTTLLFSAVINELIGLKFDNLYFMTFKHL